MSAKPNLFIVGAPKCGTTALSEYLRARSDVFMCTPKEPSYFASDLPGLRFVDNESDYLRLFKGVKRCHKIVGDASPSYLFSKCAIAAIRAFNPSARLIVTFRDPIEMLPSYHSQLLYSLFEDQRDFEAAWQMQQDRIIGRMIPAGCREPRTLLYGSIASFADQMKRVLNAYPSDQILVVLFEDFRKDPQKVYQTILDFLNLPGDQRNNFPIHNPRKKARYELLNRFIHTPPYWAKQGLHRLAGTPLYHLLIRAHNFLKYLNTQTSDPLSLSPTLAAIIRDTYQGQINELQTLLKRDLGHWLRT